MSHPFDLTDAANQGTKDAQEGEPKMDLNMFRKYTHSASTEQLDGGDPMDMAYRVYCDAYDNS